MHLSQYSTNTLTYLKWLESERHDLPHLCLEIGPSLYLIDRLLTEDRIWIKSRKIACHASVVLEKTRKRPAQGRVMLTDMVWKKMKANIEAIFLHMDPNKWYICLQVVYWSVPIAGRRLSLEFESDLGSIHVWLTASIIKIIKITYRPTIVKFTLPIFHKIMHHK